MKSIRLRNGLFALAVLLLGAGPVLGWLQDRDPNELAPITVLAVRHAEKAADGGRDPELSDVGRTRARDLARLLEHAGVTHLFTTDYKRTRATLAPLARVTGLEVLDYSPRDLPELLAHLNSLKPGSIAVVCGHSNTTPDLVRGLGGQLKGLTEVRGQSCLGEDEYDRLFVTVLASELARGEVMRTAKTMELRYGD